MSEDWNTKYGPRRVRRDPPTLEEAIFAAAGITEDLDAQAEIAAALMSIYAVKGVEIGAGFAAVTQRGSEHRDEITPQGFLSNHAGGILGGIATGQPIVASMALKPASSILIPGRSVNRAGAPVEVRTTGRHDPCVGIRAVPIGEAMVACVIADQFLRHRAQVGEGAQWPFRPRTA